MREQNLVSYFFIGLFLFILYQLALILSPFFTAIFWAAILAFAFYPLYLKILGLFNLKTGQAALIATVFVVLIVVIPAAMFLVSLMKEAIELYQQVSNSIAAGKMVLFVEKVRQTMALEWIQNLLAKGIPFEETISDLLLRAARTVGTISTIQLTALTKNVLGWIFNLLVITFLLFFFFRDGSRMYDLLFQLIPMSDKNKKMLSLKVNDTFSAVIRGQFVTSIVQGTLTGLIFWWLALPLPFFFGFLTFLTSMIPVTGAATVWVPFTVYLFAIQDWKRAVILLLVGTLGISLSDNLLKPILIGGKTKLPVFLLFLGILGGLHLYGFTGLFVGPVVIALFFALLYIYQEEYRLDRSKN
ncbi:MAG: hypothetical protein A3J52_01335 [Omnitrophica bacterium RIFCSPHIGHO2_02_FULL_49_9]|nr:MAG: hypothetical protein A3J52_01335 [Omnitrophica bacterium RIFCSPHIGHO2_02_FULL_49_9]